MDKIYVNTHEAKTNLSKLLRQVEAGHEVIISRAGKPISKLVLLEEETKPKHRTFGGLEGQIWFADDWKETPQEFLDAFWESVNKPFD